ncbi:MAG: HlyD family type I secretion periplasmic adaptor subunit [Phreatobacter sp.]|uniref:HlyD family type I secretion periplasmic adaptor subunit n=1 Tax=Phreatobacter sp. TaxID=1966341 RepID=UPI0040369170
MGAAHRHALPLTATRRGIYLDSRGPAIAGFAAIGAFVAILALWASLAPLSGAAIAPGTLQVEGRRQTVQHPYGGVITNLAVADGDVVAKGQVLITLSDAEPRARLDVLLAERDSLMAQESRLVAERDGAETPAFATLDGRRGEDRVAQAIANEMAILAARRRQHNTAADIFRQKAAQVGELRRGLRAQIEGLTRQRALVDEETTGARALLASGYTPRTRVLGLERDLARIDAEIGARQAELTRAQEAVGETELEIARLDRSMIAEVTEQLRQTQAKLAEIAPKILVARDALTRTKITAPATGTVVSATVFTEGGVVQAGATLLDIVPADNPLMVDARLPIGDVSEVNRGQTADVRLVSVNRSERPHIRGEVVLVSADRAVDERSGTAYYPMRVRMNAEDVRNARMELKSGMAAEIVVTTRPRSLVDYLIGPLADEIAGSFRER